MACRVFEFARYIGDDCIRVRLVSAGKLAGVRRRVSRAIRSLARSDYLDEASGPAARGLELLIRLGLRHGARRATGLAARQVDELDDVPPDEVVDLRPADRTAKSALDHHARSLAEHLAEFLEEIVGFGRREVPELPRADLGIDPVLCLAGERFHGVRVSLDRVEPVLDAHLNRVSSYRADAGIQLVAQLVELFLDFRLGPAPNGGPIPGAATVVTERELASIALVDLVPRDRSIAAVTSAFLRFSGRQWPLTSFDWRAPFSDFNLRRP